MALLSNKTPVECFLGNLERKDLNAIYLPAVNSLATRAADRNRHFAFFLSPELKKKISKLGIELFPNAYVPHSHPACKTLENYLLFDCLPGIIRDEGLICCSIKDSKVKILQDKVKKGVILGCINRLLDSKDISRYKSVQFDQTFNFLENRKFSKNFLKSLRNKDVFFHDEVHHWSKETFFSFLEGSQCRRFIFTIVYPVELLNGFRRSQNPDVYDFDIVKGNLFFYPDGCTSEGYQQQLNLSWLFKASKFRSGNKVWTMLKHKSVYSHHLFEVVPGDLYTSERHVYSDFDTVDLSKLFVSRTRAIDHFPVKFVHLYKIYSYLLCLKKADIESGFAKLRQILGDEPNVKEFLFFEQFCKRLIKRKTACSMFDLGFFEKISNDFFQKLPDRFKKFYPGFQEKNTFDFLLEAGCLRINVDRRDCYRHITDHVDSFLAFGNPCKVDLLDPLQFFDLNDNFNEIRNDDIVLDSVRIPLWNFKPVSQVKKNGFFKKSLWDALGDQLNNEWSHKEGGKKETSASECRSAEVQGKGDLLRITWNSDDRCFTTLAEMISDNNFSGISAELQHEAFTNTCKFMVVSAGESKKKFEEILLDYICGNRWILSFLRFHHSNFVTDESGVEKPDSSFPSAAQFSSGGSLSPRANSSNLSVQEMGSDSCSDSSSDLDLGSAGEEVTPQQLKSELQFDDEVKGKLEGSEKATEIENGGFYQNLFKAHICNVFHGDKIDVPGDGNCFFHCICTLFDVNGGFRQLRKDFKTFLINVGQEALASICNDGVFFECEMMPFFCAFFGIKIVVHCADESCWIFGEVGDEVHMFNDSHHFQIYPMSKIKIDLRSGLELLDNEENFMVNHRLSEFSFDEKDFMTHTFKGRRAAFFSKGGLNYGHNGVLYPNNQWIDEFDDILALANPQRNSFNAALLQWYDEGASIGLHKDNELVYSDDPILTVNLVGEAEFSLEVKVPGEKRNRKVTFLMTPGSIFLMPRGLQKQTRHSVIARTYRVSITFRLHVRMMDGSRIEKLSEICDDDWLAKLINTNSEEEGANITHCSSPGTKEKKIMRINDCLLEAISISSKVPKKKIIERMLAVNREKWLGFLRQNSGATESDCLEVARDLGISIEIAKDGNVKVFGDGSIKAYIKFECGHYSTFEPFAEMNRSFVSGVRDAPVINAASGVISEISCSKGYNLLNFNAVATNALTLIQSFMNRTTGICCSEIFDNGAELFKAARDLASESDQIEAEVHCLVGFAGSGKSRALQAFLKKKKNASFCVVSPRTVLAADWTQKIADGKVSGFRNKICTFERFLKMDKSKMDLIVLDELTLFPNGYLDLIVFELSKVRPLCTVVCLFDPLQARYHSDSDCNILTFDHEVDRMIRDKEINYIYATFRMSNNFFSGCFDGLQMLSEKKSSGSFWIFPDVYEIKGLSLEKGLECDVLLVESQLEKKAFGHSIKVLTFGEAQGLTFRHPCILLSESSASSNELRWMVALTRPSERVSFCCTFLGGIDAFLMKTAGKLINSFINRETISVSRIKKLTCAKLIMQSVEIGKGIDEVDREERLEGDPFLKPFIFLGQRVNLEDPNPEPVEAKIIELQTHLFISESNFANGYNFDLIREKEEREYREDMSVTEQFTDNFNKQGFHGKRNVAGPFRFKSIYPKHSNDDDMTFLMACRKRLRFDSQENNKLRYENAKIIGGVIYQNFKRTLKLSFNHDQGLLDECVNSFEAKKLEKSVATIKSHAIRSDVDWAMNDVFLFMKSQLCTKFEKQYVDAKAGQTLACFQHLILVGFAPYCRYMEQLIRRQLPEEFYIHSNKNFDDLNAWVKKFFQRDICVESDYEAFDASQDEYILAFEVFLMKDVGIPDNVIDAYIELKCNLGCKIGGFAIMRFTGEFCTFLFNTLANMAFTLCRYEWRSGQPIAFAGDDMCALNNLQVKSEFDEVFEKISLKAKVERTENPMFCGWRLTPYGIVKEPELVYNRFQVAIEDGTVFECLENYAIEVSYAYSLSERLYEVLKSERQIQYHQAVVRFIVIHIERLRTKVKDLFKEQSSDDEPL